MTVSSQTPGIPQTVVATPSSGSDAILVGGIVGAVALVCLTAGIMFFMWLRHQKQNKPVTQETHDNSDNQQNNETEDLPEGEVLAVSPSPPAAGLRYKDQVQSGCTLEWSGRTTRRYQQLCPIQGSSANCNERMLSVQSFSCRAIHFLFPVIKDTNCFALLINQFISFQLHPRWSIITFRFEAQMTVELLTGRNQHHCPEFESKAIQVL